MAIPDAGIRLRRGRVSALLTAAALAIVAPGVVVAAGSLRMPGPGYLVPVVLLIAYGAVATWYAPRLVRPGTGATATELLASLVFVQLAMAASPSAMAMALSILAGTSLLYLLAAPISIAVLLGVVYPVDRTRRAVERRLEST